MDSLIAASESFYDNSKEEEVNVELFNSFMKRIAIWDYSCITSIIFHYQIMKRKYC